MSELGDFIADNSIDYWIYGHSHENIDAEIGNTKVLSNQLGCLFNGGRVEGFSKSRFVEV